MSLLKKAISLRVPAASSPSKTNRDVTRLLKTIEEIYHIKDLDSLLERILFEARRFANADAGTLYLVAGKYLYFSYVQNDTLFRDEKAKDKYLYSSQTLEIAKNSLAGYAASTGESLLIDDVYDIRSDVSYAFNPSFDYKTKYRSRSILVVPLKVQDENIVGVLQLINAKNEQGEVVPFSMQDKLYITQFAHNAATAIEKAKLSREMVLRMVEMAELRDPYETSQHAKRVGAYTVELFDKWAERHAVSSREVKNTKDLLRTAAMLHDVGKVAVSDTILKKSSSLTPEERMQVRFHTVHGARLFKRSNSPWDTLGAEVALNHHETWDGKGYPGKIDTLLAREVRFGPGKKGMEIPLSARLVALADVYDALISERAYKRPWKEDDAFQYIRAHSGKQFDPQLAGMFLNINDVIKAIGKKYSY